MLTTHAIHTLLQAGESLTQEFKSSFTREAIESLVAFANTCGGTVFIGVADDGTIQGTTIGKETLNEWLGQIKSTTSPSIIPDIVPLSIEGKTVVAIRIMEYPVKPINTKGKYYKRIASSNHQLGLSEITDLYLQSLQLSWDSYEATGASLNELSLQKIETFIVQVNESGRFNLDSSPLLALEKLKFITNNRPTWAAMLLFAEQPLRHHIHIGRFKTPTMIIDDRQITDTLFEAVEQAMRFMISYIPVSFSFDGSLQRKERLAYPLPALREALINAIVHRDYSNASDIQIKIFDNKISIFSPGRLYGGITVEDLATDSYQSQLRNKLIAEAFYLTKNIEKYGSGFLRIRKELEAYADLTLVVEEKSGGLVITFARSGTNVEGVNGGVNDVLAFISRTPGVKTSEIRNSLPIAQRTLERHLKQLRLENRIKFVGPSKTGGYVVVE